MSKIVFQNIGGLRDRQVRSRGMKVTADRLSCVSKDFADNIRSLWRATPQPVVTKLRGWNWYVFAEHSAHREDDLPAAADVNGHHGTINYYEYSFDKRTGGWRKNTIDEKVHYHEIWHAIEASTFQLDDFSYRRAYLSDYAQLAADDVASHPYFLSHDRSEEIAPPGRNAKAWGIERSMEETRAELAAEHIVDGGGTLTELMPLAALTVATDLLHVMPCLACRPIWPRASSVLERDLDCIW